MKKHLLLYSALCMSMWAWSQGGTIKGKVFNAINNEAIPFASIGITSLSVATTSDVNGNYELKNLNPGLYNITASYIGFSKKMCSKFRSIIIHLRC